MTHISTLIDEPLIKYQRADGDSDISAKTKAVIGALKTVQELSAKIQQKYVQDMSMHRGPLYMIDGAIKAQEVSNVAERFQFLVEHLCELQDEVWGLEVQAHSEAQKVSA